MEIKRVKENSVILTKPAEDIELTRADIKEKIALLKMDLDNLEVSVTRIKADLAYYRDLLSQMPK